MNRFAALLYGPSRTNFPWATQFAVEHPYRPRYLVRIMGDQAAGRLPSMWRIRLRRSNASHSRAAFSTITIQIQAEYPSVSLRSRQGFHSSQSAVLTIP